MKKRTKILIGFVAIVIVLVAIVAVAASGDDDDDKVRYNYEIELTKSFVTGSGYTETADAGEQYAIVTWTVANDSYSSGFTNNVIIFYAALVVNGISYHTSSVETYLYPGYAQIEIAEGHTASFVYVYEIPDTIAVSDITMDPDYNVLGTEPNMERDTSL